MALESHHGPPHRDVEQALALFARTVRARRLYTSGNAVVTRMKDDLHQALEQMFRRVGDISLRVRPDCFVLDERPVLEDANQDDSIPYVFFRDGIRRLELASGLTRDEIDVLVDATIAGLAFSGFGDDLVAVLWRHSLEHVRYVAVDTTIIDVDVAPKDGGPHEPAGDFDIDARIEGLLHAIYGESRDDVGPRSIHVDATDLQAKAIANALDHVDDELAGLHPARAFATLPAYAGALVEENDAIEEDDLAARALRQALLAFAAPLDDGDASGVSDGLLRMYDAALLDGDIRFATHIVEGIRQAAAVGHERRTHDWLAEAASDARLRRVAAMQHGSNAERSIFELLAFFRACGAFALPSLIGMLSSFSDPGERRQFSDLAIELGIDKLDLVRELIASEQAFVAREGMYILSRMRSEGARSLFAETAEHHRAEVRAALLEFGAALPAERREEIATALLGDEDLRVRVAAAKTLAEVGSRTAAKVIEEAVQLATFEDEPFEQKCALLESYAILAQARGLHLLERYLKKGDGLLANSQAEEIATAAALALVHVRTARSIDILRRACVARSKRIREAARQTFVRLRGDE